MATRATKNMELMSKLANRVLRNSEKQDREEKEKTVVRSIQDDLLKITSSIANIRQMQSECQVQEKSLERNIKIQTKERDLARRRVRHGSQIQNDWHHKNRQQDVISTGYQTKIMMLKAQRTKLQRRIEEKSENGKEVIQKSILEHADLRGLERELNSSQKEMERINENILSASERVEKEEEKMAHLADRVKREVNQALVQAIAIENELSNARMEVEPLRAKRMDLLRIIEDLRNDVNLARRVHENEKEALMSRIKSEESANDEIMSRIQAKSSMKDVMLDLEETQKEKMDLQTKIDDVNEVNTSLKKEIHEIGEILSESSAGLQKYNAETERMIFEIEATKSHIDILTAQIHDATLSAGRFDSWKQHEKIQGSRLQNKMFHIKNLERRLSSLESEEESVKKHLKNRVRDLIERIKIVKEKLAYQKQVALNLQDRHEELYETLQIVTKRYEKTHRMVQEVNEEIMKRKIAFETKRLKRAEAKQKLEDAIAEKDVSIVNLQDEKRAEDEEVGGIQDAVDSVLEDAKKVDLEFNFKINELTEREKDLNQTLRHTTARNSILDGEISNTRDRISSSHKLAMEIKDRSTNVTQSVNEETFHLEQRIKIEMGKIDHLRDEIASMTKIRNEIRMKFEKLDYVRHKISSDYRSLKESDSNATLRLEDIKEDEIDLEGRVDTLEQEHGFTRRHVRDKIDSLGKTRSKLVEMKALVKSLKTSLSELELRHGDALLEIKRERMKIKSLTREVKDQEEMYEKDAAMVRPKLEKMEQMLNEKTTMILKLERAENKLRARINEYEVNLEQQMKESDVRKNSYLNRLQNERHKISEYKATLDRLQIDITKCKDLKYKVEENELSVSARLQEQIAENIVSMNEVRTNDKKVSNAQSSEHMLTMKERDYMKTLTNVRKSRTRMVYEKSQSEKRSRHIQSQLDEIKSHNTRLKAEFKNVCNRENALLLQISAHRAHIHVGGRQGHEVAEEHAEKSFEKLLRLADGTAGGDE